MQPRNALVLAVVACVALGGCNLANRLTFVKPDLERKDGDYLGQTYDFGDDSAAKKRISAHDRLVIAQHRMQAGEYAEAEKHATAALKADPKSVRALVLLGMLQERAGKEASAGGHYAQAAKLAPQDAGVLHLYATWLCSNGRIPQSLPVFDEAIRQAGATVGDATLANAGACAAQAGDAARAERELRAALASNPDSTTALSAMAQVKLGAGQYMEARAFSERRLAAGPATRQSLQLASQIEQKLGDTEAAARYVQRLRTEFPQAGGPGVAGSQ